MKSVLRVIALLCATAWLMGQASCVDTGGSGQTTRQPSGRWTAVVWSKPSTYKPAAQARGCNPGDCAVS